ncbi:MAG: type II toxin-antitoxin system VapC family toxin [Actinomycetes bacterium]
MIVVDSAGLVDALTTVAGSEELRADLARNELPAPTLIDFEVVSAVRGHTLGGHLSAERAEDFLTDFDDLPIERWPAAHPLRRRAFQLRHSLSACDAAYVALAEALDCPPAAGLRPGWAATQPGDGSLATGSSVRAVRAGARGGR